MDVSVRLSTRLGFARKSHMQRFAQSCDFVGNNFAHMNSLVAQEIECFASAGRGNLHHRLGCGELAADNKEQQCRSKDKVAELFHVLARFGGYQVISAKPLNQIKNAAQQFGRYQGLNQNNL